MPQILMLSTHRHNAVNLVSAGDDQLAICNPLIYLEAVVAGSLIGHTSEWVQLSGTPTVTLISTSAYQAYYDVVGLPGSDKVFRFYVDRNTPFEQYKDIVVRTTPFSKASQIEYSAAYTGLAAPVEALPSAAREVWGSNDIPAIPFTGVGVYSPDPLIFNWPLPEAFYTNASSNDTLVQSEFQGYQLQIFDGTTWQTVATYGVNDLRETALTPGDRFRLGVLYRTDREQIQVTYTPWRDAQASIIAGVERVGQTEYSQATVSATIARTVFKLDLRELTDDAVQIEYSQGSLNSTVVRTVYIIESRTYDETATQIEVASLHTKFSVTRVTGGAIGG